MPAAVHAESSLFGKLSNRSRSANIESQESQQAHGERQVGRHQLLKGQPHSPLSGKYNSNIPASLAVSIEIL